MSSSLIHVNSIYRFGDCYALNQELGKDFLDELEKYKDKWVQYNPRKTINRTGLSVFNYTGKFDTNPALDSLSEYNHAHGTNITEENCNKPTKLYKESKILKEFFKDMLPWCVRTHFIKLGPGGFFPPHRDHRMGVQTIFRMIVPVKNCNPPHVRFFIEDRTLYWEYGTLYVVNTIKQHSLFNASSAQDSIWLIINARVCEESINFVSSHFKEN